MKRTHLTFAMKEKGITLHVHEDDAQVATSVGIVVVHGQPMKKGKPIYATDFPGLVSPGLDATSLTITYTESDEDGGSIRVWKDPEGVPHRFRKCSICGKDFLASARSNTSTCGTTCRKRVSDSYKREKRAKAKASAEGEVTKSLKVFVCEVCQHECKTQSALDNHTRLKHGASPS